MAEPLPWREGPSILAVISAAERPGDAELPDERPAEPFQFPQSLRFGDERPGPIERVRGFVGGRRTAAGIVARLAALVRNPGDEQRLALYRSAQDEEVLDHVDAVLERLVRDTQLLAAAEPHARWLVREARHRGPLKLGIAILGLSGGAEDVATLKTLAAHHEFTVFCCVGLQNLLPDPADALWDVARSVDGGGKIEAVERLAPLAADRADIKRWLLTDGVEDACGGYTCATAGGLADALRGDVDDELLDGACVVVDALCAEGADEDMYDYEDGPAVVRRLLDLLEDRCTTVLRLDAVLTIRAWFHEDDEIGERCAAIVAREPWAERLREAYEHGDPRSRALAWDDAPHVGVDLWDAGFARLEREPLDEYLVGQLAWGADGERLRRVIEWAEPNLPVAPRATGPAPYMIPAQAGGLDGALMAIVEAMGEGEHYSEPLVAAALLSPVAMTRDLALDALAAQPRSRWGERAEQALERLLRQDSGDEVRERVAVLAARTG